MLFSLNCPARAREKGRAERLLLSGHSVMVLATRPEKFG